MNGKATICEGHFERTHWNPAFKIVFAYHSADGSLDIYAQGGTKIRSRLAHIFARAVLGADHGSDAPRTRLLRSGAVEGSRPDVPDECSRPHPARPRFKSMKLRFHGSKPAVFEVSIDGRRKQGSIHEVIADKLREKHARLATATMIERDPTGFLADAAGQREERQFRISAPSFCDLEDSPEEQVLRGYLPDWGIQKNANGLATAA